ncbi:MAG: polysaccharide deacetylase family protein [Firmicutes bacterium]|nr:polysaccharide deacetylase family protein [Bacillota bacterium]
MGRLGKAGGPERVLGVGLLFLILSPLLTLWRYAFLAAPAYPETRTGTYQGIIYSVPVEEKVVAITFDDGPTAESTPAILDALGRHGAKATFFLVGAEMRRAPAVGREIVARGHEVACHGYSHSVMTRYTPAEMERELDRCEEAFLDLYGSLPRYFRFPYFEQSPEVLKVVQSRGYTVIGCSIDSRDWRAGRPGDVVRRILNLVQPGFILLFHDIRVPGWPERIGLILDELLPKLEERGYRVLTVSQLLAVYRKESRAAEP